MRTNVNLSIPGTHVRLGDRAKCQKTEFVGIADTYARHLTGCDTVYLTARASGEKQEVEGRWVDVMCLEVVESNAMNVNPLPKEIPPVG